MSEVHDSFICWWFLKNISNNELVVVFLVNCTNIYISDVEYFNYPLIQY